MGLTNKTKKKERNANLYISPRREHLEKTKLKIEEIIREMLTVIVCVCVCICVSILLVCPTKTQHPVSSQV